jgi:hypothetical protein
MHVTRKAGPTQPDLKAPSSIAGQLASHFQPVLRWSRNHTLDTIPKKVDWMIS